MNAPTSSTTNTSRRRPNYAYTNISVTLVLLLLGVFGLWLIQAAHLGKIAKEQVDILVELREGTSEVAIKDFSAALSKKSYIIAESVTFKGKDQALAEMGTEISRDLQELDLPNPFRDMISFNVTADNLKQEQLEEIVLELKEEAVVLDVFYQENLIDEMVEKAQRFGWVLLGIGLLLVLIAMILIHNMVRLSLYANRFLIKSQQLVGATWRFISRPYLRRAALHGLLCGLLAIAVLFGLQYWLNELLPELDMFGRLDWLAMLYGAIVLMGLLISWLSHYITVRRYLRMRTDDLY